MPSLTTISAMAVLLGVVILVHEWGHYIAARLCGIRVDVFSIGFGPRIWGWKRGATDYRVSILPLGGYVKMAGDNPMEERAGAPDEFLSKPRWQRAIVAVAGPVMNVVLMLVLMFFLLWYWGVPYEAFIDNPPTVVGFPNDAVGAKAGMRAGDTIVQVGETPVASWKETYREIRKVEVGDVVRLVVERAGERIPIKFQRRGREDANSLFGYLPIRPVVGEIIGGRPASQAGMREGDLILSVNGQPVAAWGQFTTLVRASQGEALEFRIRRNDSEMTVSVTPVLGLDDMGQTARLVGIGPPEDIAYENVTASDAVKMSFSALGTGTERILGVLGGLFQGRVSIKNLGGVIEIGRQAGRAARKGIQRFIDLTALISLNLAILNLLPIPILDGGHLLLLAIEGSMRRDLSVAVKERFLQFGMVFLLVVFAVVMYNDVLRALPGR